MILKPIPARSDYPFDPDNPVPNGTQLPPADLRAKYYKVINPQARFYSGDARFQRDRRAERDPKRTSKFKLTRADGQEYNEGTQQHLIADVVAGRWFGPENANETKVDIDFAAMSQKPAFKHDHDMFSLVSNKYGREYRPDRGPPKTDFITKNAKYAKFGGTVQKGTRQDKEAQRTRSFSSVTKPSRADLAAACNTLVDADSAPFMMRWLESQATSGDKISFMKAYQALSNNTSKKPSAHQKAIAHAQTLRKMIKAGVPAGMEGTDDIRSARGHPRSHSVADFRQEEKEYFQDYDMAMREERESENNNPQDFEQMRQRPSTSDGYASSSRVRNKVGTFRPPTAYLNTLPMPPEEGEVPPPDRLNAGIYPFDWKPRPRVQQLKDKLQDILQTKHKHLAISFRRFDEDHHGTVDLNELYRVMVVESGIACTRAELEEVWDLFDRDRDGVIKYADYSKTMGNDALDERDYFQIAQRRAAGRYNEEVKFYKTQQEQTENSGTLLDDPNSAVNLNLKQFYEAEENGVEHGHINLFSVPDRKVGALFNEKFKKRSHTVENTNAHNLRIEVAAKILERFGSVESAFEHYSSGRGHISEKYFADMLMDLGLNPEALTVSELFQVYDKDLDGKLIADDFCESFQLERQNHEPPDIFFQDVVLTDVPPRAKHKKPPWADEETRRHFQEMLTQHATKHMPGKLIPAKTRKMGGGSRQRLGDADAAMQAQVGSMMPPRPVTALSASGGFEISSLNANQRAATPLQQLQALQKTSADVRDNVPDYFPPRAASTPPVPGPRSATNEQAPSALAASGALKRPKSSVPKGVATDFKIRPQTAQHLQVEDHSHTLSRARKNRPFSAADGLPGGVPPGAASYFAPQNGTKKSQAAIQSKRLPQHDAAEQTRMRPMSAADHFSPAPRKEDRYSRPFSAAVPAIAPAGAHIKTGVFAQETSGDQAW